MMYQILGVYFEDDYTDELTNNPVLTAILGKQTLATQTTFSRSFNRMDETTLQQFYDILPKLRKIVYAMKRLQILLLDLDSNLLDTYGHQQGEGFNFHYQSHRYHPIVCYDEIIEDLLRIERRNSTDYFCTGVVDFLQPLLDEFPTEYPDIPLLLWCDNSFATPVLYKQCETTSTSYTIRLKQNKKLRALASEIEDQLIEMTQQDKVSYAAVYGKFMYQVGN